MKRLLPYLIVVLFLAACGGSNATNDGPEYDIDEATGLPLNPDPIPEDTEFILEGIITSMNLTPQTAPEFVVRAPSGKTYRIRPQSLADINYDDGSTIGTDQFTQGMSIRATVSYAEGSAATGNAPFLVTSDLVVVRQE